MELVTKKDALGRLDSMSSLYLTGLGEVGEESFVLLSFICWVTGCVCPSPDGHLPFPG